MVELPSRAELLSPEQRRDLTAPALRTFFRIAGAWSLSEIEQGKILGLPDPTKVRQWQGEGAAILEAETLERISYVLGIFEGLNTLLPSPSRADAWMRTSNPPQKFDIARSVRVFSSQLQYIELRVQNCRFSSRRVTLPPELLNVADKNLKDRISSGIRPPADALGPFKIDILDEHGRMQKRQVNEKWLSQERERIEQSYTFEVPKYGRVILRSERAKFDAEVERFEINLCAYRAAVNASLDKVKSKFANTMVTEFLPRWKQRPPDYMMRFNENPPEEDLKAELHRIANELLDKAFVFEEPSIRVVPKEIAPESAAQEEFLVKLRVAMEKKRIPVSIIASLFRNFDAAQGAKQEELSL